MRKINSILLILVLIVGLMAPVWAAEHSFVDLSVSADGGSQTHTRQTGASDETDDCEHTFSNWETVIEPNNGKPGMQSRTCTICGLRETQELECLHVRTEVRNKKEAGCKDGYSGDAYCEDCGILVLEGETIPATGNHILGAWVTVGEQSVRYCTLCEYKEVEEDDDDPAASGLGAGKIIFLVVAALALVAAVVYALYLNKTQKQATAKKHPPKKKKK